MNSYLADILLDLIVKHLGPKVTGLEAQLLADEILDAIDEWFSNDIHA